MNVRIDQETCIGCGLCAGTCPDVFRLNDDGKAEVYAPSGDATHAAVQECIDACPVSAIEWAE